ncbi:hypothetical protein ANO11243_020300 [Dothideomycetidae sp. 11243]|nr:hypothetical protein ANO11243_020300 [fungal sp. No.11243]
MGGGGLTPVYRFVSRSLSRRCTDYVSPFRDGRDQQGRWPSPGAQYAANGGCPRATTEATADSSAPSTVPLSLSLQSLPPSHTHHTTTYAGPRPLSALRSPRCLCLSASSVAPPPAPQIGDIRAGRTPPASQLLFL